MNAAAQGPFLDYDEQLRTTKEAARNVRAGGIQPAKLADRRPSYKKPTPKPAQPTPARPIPKPKARAKAAKTMFTLPSQQDVQEISDDEEKEGRTGSCPPAYHRID